MDNVFKCVIVHQVMLPFQVQDQYTKIDSHVVKIVNIILKVNMLHVQLNIIIVVYQLLELAITILKQIVKENVYNPVVWKVTIIHIFIVSKLKNIKENNSQLINVLKKLLVMKMNLQLLVMIQYNVQKVKHAQKTTICQKIINIVNLIHVQRMDTIILINMTQKLIIVLKTVKVYGTTIHMLQIHHNLRHHIRFVIKNKLNVNQLLQKVKQVMNMFQN